MGFYRVYSSADAWITNKFFVNDDTNRASGSNFGSSPNTRIFNLSGTYAGSGRELGRALYQFNITALSGLVFNDQKIPSSSVVYTLRLFDQRHDDTVPTSYELFAYPLSRSWQEGSGSDVATMRDYGWANWMSSSSTQTWDTTGSDFQTTGYGSGSMLFDQGHEDLEMNVTEIVENWLSDSIGSAGFPNNGVVVKLGTAEEDNTTEYWLKLFHSRETKFVDKVPYIQAEWDSDILKDERGNFAYDQDSNLYFYNFIRGQLTGASEPVIVRVRDNLEAVSSSYDVEMTASRLEFGIYSASFNIEFTSSFSASWTDTWFSASRVYMTGTFTPLELTGSEIDQYNEFVVNVTNLKDVYRSNEEVRMKVQVRKRDFTTHSVVHTASLSTDLRHVENMWYSVQNNETGEVLVPFATGSINYTQLSYNKDGNFFDIFMQNFVPGFQYRFLFLIENNKDRQVVDDDFLFRIM